MGKGWRYVELPNVFSRMENEKYGGYGQWALNIPALFSYVSFLLSFPRRSLLPCVKTEEWEVDDWIQMR
jgi:Na+-translocating ferredoxin:NAD+ oxidoreductase RnfD subunit